jgi:anti-sigma B factor antagonist
MTELLISERMVDDILILDLTGKITIAEGSVDLRKLLRRRLEEGVRKFVLNLAGVSYIDSSGIGEITSAFTVVAKSMGILVITGFPQKLVELLAINRILSVFDIYDSVPDAVAYLKTRSFEDYAHDLRAR